MISAWHIERPVHHRREEEREEEEIYVRTYVLRSTPIRRHDESTCRVTAFSDERQRDGDDDDGVEDTTTAVGGGQSAWNEVRPRVRLG